MKKSEEKTGKEKYKLWWILDYFFEKDRTDKSGKSKGKKAFAVGVTATMIALLAFAGSATAQGGDDWPYDNDPMAVDSLDDMLNPTPGGIYAPGGPVTIKAGASIHNEDAVVIDIYDPDGNRIHSEDLGNIAGIIEEFDIDLPMDAKEGLYEIRANGISTDDFTVGAEEIPEFPTVALPLIASVLLVWGFMRKKK